MNHVREKGFTLIELLLTITITAILVSGTIFFLSTLLQVQAQGSNRSEMIQEAVFAMKQMTGNTQKCTFVFVPNNHAPTRDILAISGFTNEDNDYYFGDPLFPRINEDPDKDINLDLKSGIAGIDDNGNGSIDEEDEDDDDEDGDKDEDAIDGIDNDGDGNIDEDPKDEVSDDGQGGIKDMDDDGDGSVDEGDHSDDDEDGVKDESIITSIIYYLDAGTLWEARPTSAETWPIVAQKVALCKHVSTFQIIYEAPDAIHDPRIRIILSLTGEEGETVTLSEYVYPRNSVQKTGKRVQ